MVASIPFSSKATIALGNIFRRWLAEWRKSSFDHRGWTQKSAIHTFKPFRYREPRASITHTCEFGSSIFRKLDMNSRRVKNGVQHLTQPRHPVFGLHRHLPPVFHATVRLCDSGQLVLVSLSTCTLKLWACTDKKTWLTRKRTEAPHPLGVLAHNLFARLRRCWFCCLVRCFGLQGVAVVVWSRCLSSSSELTLVCEDLLLVVVWSGDFALLWFARCRVFARRRCCFGL